MSNDVLFLGLLVIHVGSMVAWMGGMSLFVSVISPSIAKMSPAARGEFVASTVPRYFRFTLATAITSVIAGLALYGYMISIDQAPTGSAQVSLSAGAALGLIALILLLGLGLPAGRKMVAIVKQMGSAPNEGLAGQMMAQQRKAMMGARIGLALLGITLILMILGAEL